MARNGAVWPVSSTLLAPAGLRHLAWLLPNVLSCPSICRFNGHPLALRLFAWHWRESPPPAPRCRPSADVLVEPTINKFRRYGHPTVSPTSCTCAQPPEPSPTGFPILLTPPTTVDAPVVPVIDRSGGLQESHSSSGSVRHPATTSGSPNPSHQDSRSSFQLPSLRTHRSCGCSTALVGFKNRCTPSLSGTRRKRLAPLQELPNRCRCGCRTRPRSGS